MNGKIIVNDWQESDVDRGVRTSKIVDRNVGCEGIDICRYEGVQGGELALSFDSAHIFSLLKGAGTLTTGDGKRDLDICAGTHIYVPPSQRAKFRFTEKATAIHASAPGDRPHGERLIVHSERYLAPVRFILTPQYLSRRAFLNRDHTLISKSGDRVAWFHTTMFDTLGLPLNQEGLPVFKMSYDHQTEANIVYEVGGKASVRFADHPYVDADRQCWSNWFELDDQTTYYLNEGADGPEVERVIDPNTGDEKCLRNRHEIYIAPGSHVSLCCLFDPGPTGLEMHQPGEYSSYAPVSATVRTEEYKRFKESMAEADEMIRTLSLGQATNGGEPVHSSTTWPRYEALLNEALQREDALVQNMSVERKKIVEPWRVRRLSGY